MLSELQQYILIALLRLKKAHPKIFRAYYQRHGLRVSEEDQTTSIIRSVDRLIDRGLLVARGKRTKEKWFIDEIILTPEGRTRAKQLRLQPLPLIAKSKPYANSKKT